MWCWHTFSFFYPKCYFCLKYWAKRLILDIKNITLLFTEFSWTKKSMLFTVVDVMMTHFFSFCWLEMLLFSKILSGKNKQVLLILDIRLFCSQTFHGLKKVSYLPPDCCGCDDDKKSINHFVHFVVDLKCYFCLKYWVKRINRCCSSWMFFCFHLFSLSFQGLYNEQKEKRLFWKLLMTRQFTDKGTQFHVKDRLTSTGSCINHTASPYNYIYLSTAPIPNSDSETHCIGVFSHTKTHQCWFKKKMSINHFKNPNYLLGTFFLNISLIR